MLQPLLEPIDFGMSKAWGKAAITFNLDSYLILTTNVCMIVTSWRKDGTPENHSMWTTTPWQKKGFRSARKNQKPQCNPPNLLD